MSDLTIKKQNIARNAVIYSMQLVDAINGLLELKNERVFLSQDFKDSDFVGIEDLKHLTAGTVGTLLDFVVPSFQETLTDTANSGRNQQILLQVRK